MRPRNRFPGPFALAPRRLARPAVSDGTLRRIIADTAWSFAVGRWFDEALGGGELPDGADFWGIRHSTAAGSMARCLKRTGDRDQGGFGIALRQRSHHNLEAHRVRASPRMDKSPTSVSEPRLAVAKESLGPLRRSNFAQPPLTSDARNGGAIVLPCFSTGTMHGNKFDSREVLVRLLIEART
jgi:hypothetical protein